jgi:hypothetical protein
MKNSAISELLLEEWDPIGIRGTCGAEDEYSQYASPAYKIILRSSSYRELFDFLWEIETQYMGLKGNRAKTERFAQNLFKQIK